jgi:hypothetical protein
MLSLEYFIAIWFILLQFDAFYSHLEYFTRFGMFNVQAKVESVDKSGLRYLEKPDTAHGSMTVNKEYQAYADDTCFPEILVRRVPRSINKAPGQLTDR